MSWNVEDGRVSIRLQCGHTIEATEHDGGMDEVSPVTRGMLVKTALRRVKNHDCEPEIINPTFNRCNVLCDHGALCPLDLGHSGEHRTPDCEWERTSAETQLTPEQARDYIYAVVGPQFPVVTMPPRGRITYPEISYEG